MILNTGDEIRYELGTLEAGGTQVPFMHARPTGVHVLAAPNPTTYIADSFKSLGLHRYSYGEGYRTAEGWTWEESGPEFIVRAQDGVLVVSFETADPANGPEWVKLTQELGFFLIHIGDELVVGTSTNPTTTDQFKASADKGAVVAGTVYRAGKPPAKADGGGQLARPGTDTDGEPPLNDRSWWRRLLGLK